MNKEQLQAQIARCIVISDGYNPDNLKKARPGKGLDGYKFCKYAHRKREQRLRTKLQMLDE